MDSVGKQPAVIQSDGYTYLHSLLPAVGVGKIVTEGTPPCYAGYILLLGPVKKTIFQPTPHSFMKPEISLNEQVFLETAAADLKR